MVCAVVPRRLVLGLVSVYRKVIADVATMAEVSPFCEANQDPLG